MTEPRTEYLKWMIYVRFKHKTYKFYVAEGLSSALENCYKEAIFCMEADFGRDFLETSKKILKNTDRICKIALSLNRMRFNF